MKGTHVARTLQSKTVHKPKARIVRFLGVEFQRHHITICILIAVAIYIATGIMMHEFIRVFGDSVLAVAIDRAVAAVEEVQL